MTNNALDYITKDYEGFRQLMIDLIPKYVPEWTDTSQSDFGIVLIELLANGLDILSYYQDKYFNEAFLPTAQTRASIIKLCRTLGYELSPQVAAVHKIEFTKDNAYIDEEIVIPKGTKIGTNPEIGAQVVFELLDEDVVIPAGETKAEAYATHGTTIKEDILGVSDGSEFQEFKLSYPDVLVDTLRVFSEENGFDLKWEKVSDFLSSEQGDRHFTVFTNEVNEMTIRFGNGISGRIPTNGTLIKAQYRVGGGEIGNVGLGTIDSFVETEIPGITFKNTELYIRGEDVEDIEHARIVAPKHYRNAGRAVTRLDFEDIVMSIEGVNKAKCIETFNENGDVHIYVVPNSYQPLTDGLKEKILKILNEVRLVNVNPIILDTTYTELSIDLQVYTYSHYLNSDVTNRVQTALERRFNINKLNFGETVYVSDIVKEVMNVEGVKNVIVNTPQNDIEVPENSLVKLVEVNVITTGGVED